MSSNPFSKLKDKLEASKKISAEDAAKIQQALKEKSEKPKKKN